MRQLLNISLMSALLACAACSNDAEPDEDWCLDPSYKVPLKVRLNMGAGFSDYCSIDTVWNDSTDMDSTRARKDYVPQVKYYVAAFPLNPGVPSVLASSYSDVVPVDIHPGRYSMVGWVAHESAFYDDDFDELLMKNKYSYCGASAEKVAYRGTETMNIPYNRSSAEITVTPAVGHYRIVATDSADYTPSRVVVRYTSFLPAAIHGRTGAINWWWDDIAYESCPSDSVLASDFVLSQPSETSVSVTVEVYDGSGVLKARKRNLSIPLVNGGVTTVRGNFLSTYEYEGGDSPGSGIMIDTEWESTFEIEI